MKQLDILIVNFNSTDKLLNCIRSIYKCKAEIFSKIYVFDNNSQDKVDRVIDSYPQVCLIKSKRNLGFAGGVNQLLEKMTAPFAMLLNPDTIIHEGCIKRSLQFMEENPDVGIMGPKVLDTDGGTQGSARAFPTLATAFFGRTSLLTKFFPNNRISKANILTLCCNGNSAIEADWVSGACMFVRKQAIEDCGQLDEQFFMYWEDADWCNRMWQARWKVIYNPCATIMHSVGGSSSQAVFRSTFLFHRSTYRYFRKYHSKTFSLLPMLVLLVLSLRFSFIVSLHMIKRVFPTREKKSVGDQVVCTGPESLN